MDNAKNAHLGKLKEIRLRFADVLPDRMDEVRSLAAQLRTAEGEDAIDAACAALLFPVHKLAGSGAPMGYPLLGEYAAQLERALNQWRDGRATLTDDTRAVLDGHVAALTEAAMTPEEIEDEVTGEPVLMHTTEGLELPILVLCGERDGTADLPAQLGSFGYAVGEFHDVDAFISAAEHIRPVALVIDLETPDGLEKGLAALDVTTAFRPGVPVVVITAHNDIETRLRTVRAGAAAVLPYPVDLHEIVQALDRCTAKEEVEPYRVLIVEDDQDMAYFYTVLLRDAGMQAEMVTNPLDVLEPLNAFDPDVILMDVNMPHCSGIELASVIRQSRAYLQVPIIFLTSEKSAKTHLYAVRAGGDDFLRKPVDRSMLLASVKARAGRSRQLKTLITSDSMTGLLNHSSIMEALSTELMRAKRQKLPVAFAMIDIDHFKAVNDTHGHWVGDTVIKALSQVLRQRLRRTDVIGRYGGEEFAAILPDTSEEQAAVLLDRIRESFANIRHRGDDGDFQVTFSCGIAAYPDIDEVSALATGADETLYKAKQAGRNRVFRASDASDTSDV